jgi:hypothetical protein
MCIDQEHSIVRDQLWYHAVASKQQLSDSVLYLGRHWLRLERKSLCHDEIRTQDQRSHCIKILAGRGARQGARSESLDRGQAYDHVTRCDTIYRRCHAEPEARDASMQN